MGVSMDTSFLSGANATFIAEMQRVWTDNPAAVDSQWADWFSTLGALSDDIEAVPDWGAGPSKIVGANDPEASIKAVAKGIAGNRDLMAGDVRSATLDSLRAIMLIRAYRIRGHLLATLDPLKLAEEEIHPELDPATYGFNEEDFDRPIFINYVLGLEIATLSEILSVLRKTYCSTIGVEFMHIQDPHQKSWIQERMEAIRNHTEFTDLGKKTIYETFRCTCYTRGMTDRTWFCASCEFFDLTNALNMDRVLEECVHLLTTCHCTEPSQRL